MVIEIAQQIGPPPRTPVVSDHAHGGGDEHDGTNSHNQPGLVHVSLLRYTRIVALCHPRHVTQYSPPG
jgi:hypothetical protein